ncbi:glyoxal oxidase-related protein [Perilla frutescens var. hirtella]|nr:glyoxal oxidase-related protein [Perilla frutescens var. hirtella]KAH6815697.1 glyoxal oxidase-related protein [Perilla frutescens var. frutescens]
MAFKNSVVIFSLIIILSLFPLSSPLHYQHHHHFRPPGIVPSAASLSTFLPQIPPSPAPAAVSGGGEWTLLHRSVGISAMHMQLLYNNKVVIFDRTDFGPSQIILPFGKCRHNDEAIPEDCTAHSILYDVATNTYRPLMVQTDVWCSSGAVTSDGRLVQTGGYHGGDHKIRLFTPCEDELCDWIELSQSLAVQRWYSSDHILPDGRVIVVGGRRAFSYEFFPKNQDSSKNGVFYFPFLIETTDPKEENNLYPFLHLLPDGNLFVFANRRSVLLDYKKNRVLREYPVIPGEKRNYPATGSSVMLPLRLHPGGVDGPQRISAVEVMVCGGARGGAHMMAAEGVYVAASRSCGRLRVSDPDPRWRMEAMPVGRVMPDMLILPNRDVIILNGAERGTAGWESAEDPVLNPVLYRPSEPDPSKRFTVLNPSTIGRLYHSAATLLPDGRILVGGSNPHVQYNFTGVKYPTELSLEAFSPPYMGSEYAYMRPSIMSVEGPTESLIVSYDQKFSITFSLMQPEGECTVTMVAPSFTTHSFAMNQRLLVLYVAGVQQTSSLTHRITVRAPPTANVAPPGYYMVFVVHQGVPSQCAWIRIK